MAVSLTFISDRDSGVLKYNIDYEIECFYWSFLYSPEAGD